MINFRPITADEAIVASDDLMHVSAKGLSATL
jgi:hypothetical protein